MPKDMMIETTRRMKPWSGRKPLQSEKNAVYGKKLL